MIIYRDPDDWVTEIGRWDCLFHQNHPGIPYAGCGCSGSYTLRRATPKERKDNRKRRIERENLVAEAHREFGFGG